MSVRILTIALAMATTLAGSADAAVFTKTYIAKTKYDTNYFGNVFAPYTDVTQIFTIRFDSNDGTTPVAISDYSSNTPDVFSNAPGYVNFRVDGDIVYFTLSYGNSNTGTYRANFSTDILGASPADFKVSYSVKGGSSFFTSKSSSVVATSTAIVTDTAGAVPEPATWAMMMLGFGSMGYAMRRRKSAPRIRFA